ncbi:MAG: outer membrane protein transport protein [Deltaproteobacteria bacterium]
MLKKILPLSCLFLLAGYATAVASGYRVPEQSLNSTALSSAYVANAHGPDAAYFNPANMSEGGEGWEAEWGLSFINLSSISYRDARGAMFSGSSEEENFVIPNFFAVSPKYKNFRFGLALVSPAGLSKRWSAPYPATFALENTLKVIEAAPSVSYKCNEVLSIAIGLRFIYSEGVVKSRGTIIGIAAPPADEYVTISRDLKGDTTEFGYNLALTVRPSSNLTLAATYRSKIDLSLEGDGVLTASDSFPNGLIPAGFYRGAGSVSIPIPAILNLAAAYTVDKITIEFVFDRTFWSTYKVLDFNYASNLGNPILDAAFNAPITKDWADVDAFRIGLTYHCNAKLALMAATGYDGNPVPDQTLSFDLPDSNAWFASFGFRYYHGSRLSYGAAYLHARKKDRTVSNAIVEGTFSGAATHLLACSLTWLF